MAQSNSASASHASVPAGPRQYPCVTCGKSFPVGEVYKDRGRIVCKTCFMQERVNPIGPAEVRRIWRMAGISVAILVAVAFVTGIYVSSQLAAHRPAPPRHPPRSVTQHEERLASAASYPATTESAATTPEAAPATGPTEPEAAAVAVAVPPSPAPVAPLVPATAPAPSPAGTTAAPKPAALAASTAGAVSVGTIASGVPIKPAQVATPPATLPATPKPTVPAPKPPTPKSPPEPKSPLAAAGYYAADVLNAPAAAKEIPHTIKPKDAGKWFLVVAVTGPSDLFVLLDSEYKKLAERLKAEKKPVPAPASVRVYDAARFRVLLADGRSVPADLVALNPTAAGAVPGFAPIITDLAGRPLFSLLVAASIESKDYVPPFKVQVGNVPAATVAAKEIKPPPPTPEEKMADSFVDRAKISALAGKYDEARDYAQRAIKLAPNSAAAKKAQDILKQLP